MREQLTTIEPFSLGDLSEIGSGLNRPECVLAAPDGSLYTGDWTFGIARITPDGTTGPAVQADLIGLGFRPNGIALLQDGDFLITNMARSGGVWRVSRQGAITPFAIEIESRPIPPTNFVLVDGDRTWITISATSRNHEHFTAAANSGQILLVRDGSATLVADGLNWTNEVRVSPDGQFLYVNETFASRPNIPSSNRVLRTQCSIGLTNASRGFATADAKSAARLNRRTLRRPDLDQDLRR